MQVNPSALILPMEPQPPEDADEVFIWHRGKIPEIQCAPSGLWARKNGEPIDDYTRDGWLRWISPCPVQPGERLPHGDKMLLVRTIEARRVDSLTDEEWELTGLARHGAGWVWLLRGEVVT